MYFKDKGDTNIDTEFENDNILSLIIKFIIKHKVKIIILIVLLIICLVAIVFVSNNSNVTNYLVLNGEENMIIYQDSDYVEPGYDAYNSKDADLYDQVKITSTLDTNKVGEYKITYTLGDITKIRNINVVAKPKEYTYIYLEMIDNNTTVYLKLGDKYVEPGYKVFSSTGNNLTSKLKVTGTVDSSKKGSYRLIYSVVDSNNVTVSASRTVIVMDTDVSLSLSTSEYTNKDVTINIGVIDNYFDYIILPDNSKITNSSYSYKVSSNGTYNFKIYNKKGIVKDASIEVKNIDKEVPNGSCTIDYTNNGSVIIVNASDKSGINKYSYAGKVYANGKISLSSYVDNASVVVYDYAGNSKTISCKTSSSLPIISNISNDGVIVTIKAKKAGADITGYYFSYNNQRPNKDSGGYVATNNESIDVVRLPGTTYVWVEDQNGRISSYKNITLNNDVLLMTSGNNYKILKGTKLSDYLTNNGWSIDELNKLIARSVRAAGLYTKIGAATAAVSLQTVLAQKFGIKLPYESAGVYRKFGAASNWGSYGKNYTTQKSGYYGMDCSAFVTWTYVNTGYDITTLNPPYWSGWKKITFNKENGEIGDILAKGKTQGSRHVKLIIGKTDSAFITAESTGTGMVIDTHSYASPAGYGIQKGENFNTLFGFVDRQTYPSGF